MSRIVTLATIIVAIGAATTLYHVKYQVRELEKQAGSLVEQVSQERDAIRVLNAEWSYLNQPDRVQGLAERYLGMKPMTTAQLGSIDRLPLRPVPGTGGANLVASVVAPPPSAAAQVKSPKPRPKPPAPVATSAPAARPKAAPAPAAIVPPPGGYRSASVTAGEVASVVASAGNLR